jgi:hypothetical protein
MYILRQNLQQAVGRSIDSILSEIDQKWNITKLLNILIQSNPFKRSNCQVISQFIHVKDISKVNDNGNQYKQKLILWYRIIQILKFMVNGCL